MNVNRLSQVLGWLRSDERELAIQKKLISVQTNLQNLAASPGDSNHQISLNDSLKALESALREFETRYDPAEIDRIIEIGAGPYFTSAMAARIKADIEANPMTPAAAVEDVNKLVTDRKNFNDKVSSTEDGIDYFVEYHDEVEAGTAAIGFEIPRSLFDNDYKDFIDELKSINRIIRVISEVNIGTMPEIKLGNISSSDPLIFLHTTPALVASLGVGVSWALNQWKKYEEIRKLRAETAKIGQYSEKELEDFLDNKVKKSLDAAVKEEVLRLSTESSLENPRKKELESELSWALKALFARVERGMRVELSVSLLSTPEEGQELSEENAEKQASLQKVQQISDTLAFPKLETAPILTLPKSEQE